MLRARTHDTSAGRSYSLEASFHSKNTAATERWITDMSWANNKSFGRRNSQLDDPWIGEAYACGFKKSFTFSFNSFGTRESQIGRYELSARDDCAWHELHLAYVHCRNHHSTVESFLQDTHIGDLHWILINHKRVEIGLTSEGCSERSGLFPWTPFCESNRLRKYDSIRPNFSQLNDNKFLCAALVHRPMSDSQLSTCDPFTNQHRATFSFDRTQINHGWLFLAFDVFAHRFWWFSFAKNPRAFSKKSLCQCESFTEWHTIRWQVFSSGGRTGGVYEANHRKRAICIWENVHNSWAAFGSFLCLQLEITHIHKIRSDCENRPEQIRIRATAIGFNVPQRFGFCLLVTF